eukprot:scaffold7032_cov94-Cylindrotheca_fusiformis.AAC.1
MAFQCRQDPADRDSPTYTVLVPYFDNGTPEEFLMFLEKVKTVQTGQALTAGPEKYNQLRQVLKGNAKTVFDNAARVHHQETNARFVADVATLKASIFPVNALAKQKRAIRRLLRKPAAMRMRDYAARMTELNNLLLKFPPRQAGGAATKIDDDELIQCIEDGLPKRYKTFMSQHGFIPVDNSMEEFIAFIEDRLEATEDLTQLANERENSKRKKKSSNDNGSDNNRKKSRKSNHGSNNNKNNNNNDGDGSKFCKLH